MRGSGPERAASGRQVSILKSRRPARQRLGVRLALTIALPAPRFKRRSGVRVRRSALRRSLAPSVMVARMTLNHLVGVQIPGGQLVFLLICLHITASTDPSPGRQAGVLVIARLAPNERIGLDSSGFRR